MVLGDFGRRLLHQDVKFLVQTPANLLLRNGRQSLAFRYPSTVPNSIESLARVNTMQEFELSKQELDDFERVKATLLPDAMFNLKATRLKADLGPVVEIVELLGPVHASYDRDGGRWVDQLKRDIDSGLLDSSGQI